MTFRAAAAVIAVLGLVRPAPAASGASPALRAFASDLDECVRATGMMDRRFHYEQRLQRCLPPLVSYKALEAPRMGLTGVLLPDASILRVGEADLRSEPGLCGPRLPARDCALFARQLALFSALEERLGAAALRPGDPSLFTQANEVPGAWIQGWRFAREQVRARAAKRGAWPELALPAAAARLEVLWRRAAGRADPHLGWITGEMAAEAVAGERLAPSDAAERAARESPEAWELIASRLDPASRADLLPLAPHAQIVLAEAVAALSLPADVAPAVSSAAAYFESVDAAAAGFGFAAAEQPFEDSGVDQMPGGMAVLDYDLDGRPDLLLCAPGQARLMRNLGGLRFTDATRDAGLEGASCRNGASSADYDNDGWPDLLLLHGAEDRDHLYRNEGGRFTDATAAMGLSTAAAQSTSAVWLDYDGDGRLDLYLVEYGDLMFARLPAQDGTPDGLRNRLYRNEGGRFADVTAKAGVGDAAWGLGAAAFDYDGDGRTDLFVLNDFGRSALYKNAGDGTFRDVSRAAGVDFAGNGMGVSVADYDHDGRPDLFLTYIGDERPAVSLLFPAAAPAVRTRPDGETFPYSQRNRLLRNAGDGTFVDVSTAAVEYTPTGWGWNGMFLDAGNRGWLDLYLVNGWWAYRPFYDRETKVFWRYEPETGRFLERSAASGASFPGNSRVSAAADFDGDGCLDLVVAGFHPLRVLRGRCPAANHWLEVKLVGARSNRDGIGARVAVTAGGVTRSEELGPQGGGFQNSLERVVRFGLGGAAAADAVTVAWPSGTRQALGRVKADRRVVVHEE